VKALIVASALPDDVSGHGIALACDLDAYEQFFERVEYISILGDSVPAAAQKRFPRTRFSVLGIRQASPASRYWRSLFGSAPAFVADLVSRDALGRLTEAVQRAQVRTAPQVVVFESLAAGATLMRLPGVFSASVTVLRSLDVVYRGFVGVAKDHAFPLRMAWSHEVSRMRRLEAEVLSEVEVVWAITEADAKDYRTDFGVTCDGVLGVYVRTERFARVAPGDPHTVVCLGSVDARKQHGLGMFLERGWPVVLDAVPTAALIVAGRGSEEWNRPDNRVWAQGYVDDDAECLGRGAVFLNPQVSGAGIKLKSVNALAARRTLVSTPNGVKGIPGLPGVDFLVGGETLDLAGAVIRALREPELAASIAASGHRLAQAAFSRDACLEASCLLFRRSLSSGGGRCAPTSER
jgi:polysaccharide biosynthesis protein PslH